MNDNLLKLLRAVHKTDTYQLDRRDIMKVTDRGEVPVDAIYPYPSGCEEPRSPPIAATYGLTAPASAPGPRPMSPEIRALFADFYDEQGRLIGGGESALD